MTIRTRLIVGLLVVLVPVASRISFAQTQASSAIVTAPLAASASTAVPALIPYSGVALDRDGHALSGETGITFLFYKDQTGGEPLFTETQSVAPDATGHYAVRIGASVSNGIPLSLFGTGETRWLEVQIAGEAIQPRTLLTSVPYALKSADAATLGGLPASAFVLAGSPSQLSAASAALPAVTSTAVTTTGGQNSTVAVFNGPSSIVTPQSGILYTNLTSGGLGIGRGPAAALDVLGQTIFRGGAIFSRSGEATTSAGKPSFQFQFQSSVWNSNNGGTLIPNFTLQSEPTGNNTSTTGATLNFLYYSGVGAAPAETGLFVNPTGIIHFAPGQTFPGGVVTAPSTSACIATAGGFGSGGTTFVEPSFAVPAAGTCTPWAGFTKTASTVVLTTSGTACVSSDSKKLTLSLSSADPDYLGVGTLGVDYIQMTRTSATGLFGSGTDQGEFSGGAVQINCTSSLLQLNENND